MSVPVNLKKKIEEATALIEAGTETYGSLAKRYHVPIPIVYQIHERRQRKIRVEEAEEKLETLQEKITKRREELQALDGSFREKKTGLEEEIQSLGEKLIQTKKKVSSTVQDLENLIETKESLKKLGLKRVSSLARFVDDFESLDFSAEEVQRLADWRKGLDKMGIHPDRLEKFVEEKGPLGEQLSKLSKWVKAEKKKVKSLTGKVRRLKKKRSNLSEEVSNLSMLLGVLEDKGVALPCKVCGRGFVFLKLPSREAMKDAMDKRLGWSKRCDFCGGQPFYTPWDILQQLGWLALPR